MQLRERGPLPYRALAFLCMCGLFAACAQQSAPPNPANGSASTAQPSAPRQQKMLTVGVSSNVQGFGLAGGTTTAGGWASAVDIFTVGLITSADTSRQPVGQMAAKVPTLDDGSIVLGSDGTERVTYTLRQGITWQDGVPLTAQDMVFSFKVNTDPGLPFVERAGTDQMQSVEAPDDTTVVITFKNPYLAANKLGARFLWPYPQHVLQDAWDKYQASKDQNDFLNLPYWTSGYISNGPFRVTDFSPGDSVTFQAYDKYFLGQPKVSAIRIRTFGTEDALFASVLAGAVDIYMPVAMGPQLGFELQDQWQRPGNGTVHLVTGNIRILSPQARPDLQKEPANLEIPVRQALYYALDRDALANALEGGHTELAAYSILTDENPSYSAIKDDLRVYAYDPNRAKATLQQAGWKYNPDGSLVNATDGRRYSTALWSTQGSDEEVGAIADYWRQLGLAVDEAIIPAAFTRDNQYRASFPGWETTANSDDTVLSRLETPAGPSTQWAGTNRSGWDDPAGRALLDAYRQAITPDAAVQATKALSQYVSTELPFMPFVYQADHAGVRKGVQALNDVQGAALAGQPYGTHSRNAYLWDLS